MGSKYLAEDIYCGKYFKSKFNEDYLVLKYIDCENVEIMFSNGVIVTTRTVNIRNGNVPNPMRITTCGVGYHGVGRHPVSENGRKTDAYVRWQAMLNRVYSKIRRKSSICYLNVSVSPEWFNFQNFANWYSLNLPEMGRHTACVDKDIFGYRERIYSENTCAIVPLPVNMAIQLGKSCYFCKRRNKWVASLTEQIDGKPFHRSLGYFINESDAVVAYCKAKDEYVKSVAVKYKENLSALTFEKLLNFETSSRYNLMKGNL